MNKNKKMVSVDEIYKDKAIAKSQNEMNVLLNKSPKTNWIKKHPYLDVDYIPIERIEYLLTAIFTEWNVEIKENKLIGNSIVITIQLHYKNPTTGEMKFQDGIGASPLQTDKGAGATDWSKIKTSAVMKAAPAAKSFAVKDAAEQLGKIFGKDLNRADKIMYDALMDRFEDENDINELLSEVIELIDKLVKDKQDKYKDILADKKKAGELSVKLLNNIKKQVEDDLS